jgi:hypothetical protein
VSWAKLCPRTIQSGAGHRACPTGTGSPYLKGVLGEAAAAAAKTTTFLGERYRRIVTRRGNLTALVAVARSILVIIWHLPADSTARLHDLGSDYHAHHVDTGRKIRNHVSQLTGLPRHPRTHRLSSPAGEPGSAALRRVPSPAHSPSHFPVRPLRVDRRLLLTVTDARASSPGRVAGLPQHPLL